MRRAPTLRGRVSLLGLAVIAGWLFVLAAGFDIVLSVRLDQQVDDALVIRAQAASATVAVSGGRITGVRESATDAALDNSIWVYRGATALERPHAPEALQRAADAIAVSSGPFADRSGHRLHVLPVEANGRRVGAVVAAVDLGPYERTRATAILGSIVVAVLLLGGVYPALRYVAGRALRPVEAMAAQATEFSGTLPIKRFGDGQRHAELQRLADNLDELLGRLAASLRHERHLSAELSHELRTPLARIRMQVDLMMPSATPDLAAELAEVRQNCDAMNRIIDSLLAAARTELSPATGHADLGQVFAHLRANIGGTGPERDGVTLTLVDTDLVVGVDEDVVERILAPIIENAHRYARQSIHVAASRARRDVLVRVTDDGPGVRVDDVERIFEPGVRADIDRVDGGIDGEEPGRHGGAGLGLALARRLARAADGDVTVEPPDHSGPADPSERSATFVVTLPVG